MQWLIISLICLFAMHIYDYYVLRKCQGSLRIIALCILAIGAVLWPFLVPAHLLMVRFIFAIVVFNKIIKSVEIAYHRVFDASMLDSFMRYFLWSSQFPDVSWPKSKEEASATKAEGRQRLMRWLLKSMVAISFMYLAKVFPQMYNYYYLVIFWLALLTYFLFTGVADLLTGAFMQTGLGMSQMFNNPLLANSPRDFWGKRWNLYFRDVCHRNIFIPLGGKKRATLGAILVFLVSSLMHEYLIFASLGLAMFGYMSAFFMIHCVATIVQTALKRKTQKTMPSWLAIPMHTAWLVFTLPLLLEPILKIFPVVAWSKQLFS